MNAAVTSNDTAGLEEAVGCALEEARRLGASAAQASASLGQGLHVTVRLDEVEKLEHRRSRGMSVTIYFGRCRGAASTADLSAKAVRAMVQKAGVLARFTAEDPYAGLLEEQALAWDIPDLDLNHPWALEANEAIDLGRRIERAGLAGDARITNSGGASVSTRGSSWVLGNSLGFLARSSSTSHSMSCALIAGRDEQMQKGSWFTSARDAVDLEVPESVGATAARRAAARLGARRIQSRRAPVLFSPETARGIFGQFISATSGGSQYRKASFLLDAVGQEVFPAFVRMSERPHIAKGLASAPFDGEGAFTRDRELVDSGVLQGYVLDGYSARRLGLVTTGNAGGIHNLLVSATEAQPTRSHEALLRQIGSGLWVTELMGQGVNAVTGDYSRGASGFWIEEGAIAFPVHEVTIAGNLRQIYRDIIGLGDDVDARGAIRCGSVLVGQMTIAGE
jgi:PmbA protein